MHASSEDNLIWIDLEMTGLDPDGDSILEIATVVTDKDLNPLADGPEFAIRHPLERLESMDGVLQVGEEVTVKLIDIDKKTGKYRLSRKVLLPKPENKNA